MQPRSVGAGGCEEREVELTDVDSGATVGLVRQWTGYPLRTAWQSQQWHPADGAFAAPQTVSLAAVLRDRRTHPIAH